MDTMTSTISTYIQQVTESFEQMERSASEFGLALEQMAAAVNLVTLFELTPSERVAFWILTRVCRCYTLEAVTMIEQLRPQQGFHVE